MKNSTLYSVVILTLALVTAPSTQAATVTWLTPTGTNAWTNTANWSGGTLPAAGDTANITNATATNVTVLITNTATTGILNLASGNSTDYIRLNGGTLRMDNSGSQAVINLGLNGSGNRTPIQGVSLEMTAGGLAINKSGGSGDTISGGITNTTAGANTLTLTTSGSSGNLTISGAIREGSGTVNVVVDTTARVSLSGNNDFSGGILVKNGALSGSTNMGSGTITLGDASTTGGTRLVANGGTYTNNIIVSSSTTNTTDLLWRNTTGSTTELSGAIDLQKDAIVTVGHSNITMIISGNASGSGNLLLQNTGSGANGVFTLSGSNSHTGGVTLYSSIVVNGSKLILGNAHALGTGTFRVTGKDALLDSSVANLTLADNNAIELNTDLTYVGTSGNKLNLGVGTVAIGSTNRTVTVDNGVLTFGGAISGTGAATNTFTKAGAGILALNGVSTYSNTTLVSAGTLRGTGSVAGDLTIGNGAFLQAGDGGIGTFTAGGVANFQNGSTFTFELNTTAATYDQLIANGLTIGSTASITFSDLGGSAWGIGTKITIIDNTSGSAISGIFAGYAEGYEFTLGANLFKTTYLGGSGNDFALEVVPEPSTIALLVAGLGAVALLRRRRQS